MSNLVTCHERIGPCCARIIGAGDKGVPKPMMDLLEDGKQRWVIVVQIVGVFGHSYRLDAHLSLLHRYDSALTREHIRLCADSLAMARAIGRLCNEMIFYRVCRLIPCLIHYKGR